jgi:hypothetical protein
MRPGRCTIEGPCCCHIDFQRLGIAIAKGAARMALTLREVQHDPIANRALAQLKRRYSVAEEKSGLVLTKKTGKMKLFLNDLDDLHQWDFIHNQKMVQEIERLKVFSCKIDEHRENWKRRALGAEAKLAEAEAKLADAEAKLAEAIVSANRQNVSDLRYAALKRFLAKQFHPDYAPGHGIEKIVRSEIFKEIWMEIDRLDDQAVSASTTARSSSAT